MRRFIFVAAIALLYSSLAWAQAGVPRAVMLGLFPQKIVQTPKEIIVLYEYMNVFRVIPLDANHPDDILPSYMGDSAGHWERDTLVVDVIGFNDRTWLAGAGTFH